MAIWGEKNERIKELGILCKEEVASFRVRMLYVGIDELLVRSLECLSDVMD